MVEALSATAVDGESPSEPGGARKRPDGYRRGRLTENTSRSKASGAMRSAAS